MVDIALDAQEKAIVKAFGKETALTEAKIKEKGLELAKLVILERKQVVRKIEPTGRARAIKWELTEAGQKLQTTLKEAQPIEKPAAKKRPPKKQIKEEGQTALDAITMEDVIQAVTNYCNPYFERYNKIIDDLSEKVTRLYEKPEGNKSVFDLGQFQRTFQEVYENLNMKNNYGDVVPIPVIKQALQVKLTGQLRAEDMAEYFLKLEEKRVIDLQIASDPSKVPNAQMGILHPQRGLIYYVTWRSKG